MSRMKNNNSFYATTFNNIAHPISVLDLCGAKSRFCDVQYSIYPVFVSVLFYNGIDLDLDPLQYGVVYTYVYANDVAHLLYYNIQGFNPYDNNKCNNMS